MTELKRCKCGKLPELKDTTECWVSFCYYKCSCGQIGEMQVFVGDAKKKWNEKAEKQRS